MSTSSNDKPTREETAAAAAAPRPTSPTETGVPPRAHAQTTTTSAEPPLYGMEVVRSCEDPNRLQLLSWGKDTAIPPGFSLQVPTGHSWYKQALALPTGVVNHGATEDLFGSVVGHLAAAAGSEAVASLAAAWAVSTWVADTTELAPLLVITGAPAKADRLLRALHSVCRTSLLLSGTSLRELTALPISSYFAPTLLLAHPRLTPAAIPILAASCRPGYFVATPPPRGSLVPLPALHSLYSAKAIYLGELPPVRLPSTLVLHLADSVPSEGRDEVVPETAAMTTTALQNRLLHFRLTRRASIRQLFSASTPAPGELGEIASLFDALLSDAPAWQAKIQEYLAALDREAREDRSLTEEARVLEAALVKIHGGSSDRLFLSQIEEALRQQAESTPMSPEKIGHVLKRLGMRSHRLSSAGRGLMLLPPTVEQLHRLARSFEVLEPAPDRCEACRNLAPSADGACRNVGDVGLSDPAQSETATEPA